MMVGKSGGDKPRPYEMFFSVFLMARSPEVNPTAESTTLVRIEVRFNEVRPLSCAYLPGFC